MKQILFAYIKYNLYLCNDIFETVQSSATRSKTPVTKYLPAYF